MKPTPGGVRIENLSKSYGDFKALSGLNLEAAAGEITGLLGPNGAGKTTTIKLIAGLLRPDTGRVFICGTDIEKEPERAKSRFALVPDVPYLYGKLTGSEFMQFMARIYGMDTRETAPEIEKQLRVFNILDVSDDLVDSYSHGMRQRLLLASVMMRDPEVIILDEPMVGLDPQASRMVRGMLKEAASRGRCVFLSTHSLHDAEELCGKIAVISRGRLAAFGTRKELRSAAGSGETLEDVYLSITSGA